LGSQWPRWGSLLITTGLLAVTAGGIALIFGSAIAIRLMRFRPPREVGWGLLLMAGAFVPLALQAGGWIGLIGPYGLVTPRALGLGTGVRSGLTALVAVLGIHAVAAIPWVVGVVAFSLRARGTDAEEWGLTQGTLAQVVRGIMIPMHRDAFLLGMLIAGAGLWTDMSVTDLFAVRTLTEEIYTEIEGGTTGSTSMLVAVGLALVASLLLAGPLTRWVERSVTARPDPRWRLVSLKQDPLARGGRWLARAGLVLVVLPVVGLLHLWLGSLSSGQDSLRGWGADLSLVARSLVISMVAGAWGTGTASLAAWWYIHSKSRWRYVAMALACLGLFIPGPSVGLALVEILSRPSPFDLLGQIYDSPAVVIWGQATRGFPWLFLLQCGVMARTPSDRREILYLEGARWQSRYRLGPLGEFRGLMLISWVLGTALALGELATTKIVTPPGFDSLAVVMFGLLHVGTTQAQARLALTGWMVSLALSLLATWLIHSRTKR
jgi:ABC-type Fe3+ transport system permease subunit